MVVWSCLFREPLVSDPRVTQETQEKTRTVSEERKCECKGIHAHFKLVQTWLRML